MASNSFLDSCREIENGLSLGEDKRILTSFTNLWEDYYHQMIDYISKQINPLNYLHIVKESNKNWEDLPEEFKCYIVDRSIQSTFVAREQYSQNLVSVRSNMNLLCEKGKTTKVI